MTDDATNPYVAPRAEPEAPEAAGKASEGPSLQCDLLLYESFLKALGLANYIGAGLSVFMILGSLWVWITMKSQIVGPTGLWRVFVWQRFVVLPAFVALHFALGSGLNRLRPWARAVQVALSALVVLVQLVGRFLHPILGLPVWANLLALAVVVTHVGVFYYLTSPQCTRVVSPRYRAAVDASPGPRDRPGPLRLVGAIALAVVVDVGILGMQQSLVYVIWSWLPPTDP